MDKPFVKITRIPVQDKKLRDEVAGWCWVPIYNGRVIENDKARNGLFLSSDGAKQGAARFLKIPQNQIDFKVDSTEHPK